ncbi:Thiamine pyrophosphokinase [Candidatus Hepatoplasma crinochetorum Av]|uniref:Thiamine diphosphokinase n=1 Tax=Candidatus Hepatoplasma crinochetorum Av TaxID=1427984 RepID=W8GFX1_9MOLU|nr:thiamine diphosphokinase [Candidatus Hepatoplasma crinochetorum]AHK22468.1 Thiamine pyrophosphokinase [Candidatus Hepatoplasma crinochetorum Av]
MKKCLITTKKLHKRKINWDDYDFFIGVERGAKFIYNQKGLKNKYYISDFDSLLDYQKKLKKTGNLILLEKNKNFADTEEAIKYALKIGYQKKGLEIFVNEDLGRKDHLINIFNISRKYQVLIYGNKFKITPILENENVIIKKENYKYFSIFVFEKTEITTKGLKWDLNKKEFNLESTTNLISNQIIAEQCKVKFSKLSLIIQAND